MHILKIQPMKNKPKIKTTVLTSVHVDQIAFNDFKVDCVRDKYSLTKLVQHSMRLYLTDEKYKNFLLEYAKSLENEL